MELNNFIFKTGFQISNVGVHSFLIFMKYNFVWYNSICAHKHTRTNSSINALSGTFDACPSQNYIYRDILSQYFINYITKRLANSYRTTYAGHMIHQAVHLLCREHGIHTWTRTHWQTLARTHVRTHTTHTHQARI